MATLAMGMLFINRGGGYRSSYRPEYRNSDDHNPSDSKQLAKVNQRTIDLILLLLIAFLAAAIGNEWDRRFLISICLVPVLSALVTVMTLAFFERKSFDRVLIVAATSLFLATSILSITASSPEHRVPTRICPAIAVALAFPCFSIAKTSGSKMRLTIVLIFILLPILVSIIFRSFPQELRAILLLPAMVLLCYDAWAYLCEGKQERDALEGHKASPSRALIFPWHDFQPSIKPMLCCSATMILLGVLLASMPMIFGFPYSSEIIWGLASAIAGGIFFNACLVETNWERPAKIIDKQLKKNTILLMITVIALMGASVWLLGLMLDHGGVELIPIIFLVCLYFVFVYLHENIRSSISYVSMFLILLGIFAATIYATHLGLPFIGRNAENAIAQKRKEKCMAFIALMHLCLLFTNFMMTALSQAEKRTKQETTTVASPREVGNVVVAPAATTSPPPAAQSKPITKPITKPVHQCPKPCVVIEMPRSVNAHPKHSTLLMAAAIMILNMHMLSSSSSGDRSEPDPEFVFLTQSPVAQSVLLLITVSSAALTGYFAVSYDDQRSFIDLTLLASLIVTAALSLCTFEVLGAAQVLKRSLFVSSTVVLMLTAALTISTDVPDLWPLFNPQLISFPCGAITIAICLQYMIMCFKQDSPVRALVATLIVFPSLVLANLAMMWSVDVRCVLLVPALTVMTYYATLYACGSCQWVRNRALIKTLLRSSGAIILVGASVAATAIAHNVHHSKVSYACGFIVIAAAVSFNCFLLITRSEHRSNSARDVMKLWKRLLVITEILLLNSLALIGIYTCLAHSTALILIIPLSILLVCNLCALVVLHDPVYESTPTWLYFLLLLVTAMGPKLLWFRVSIIPHWSGFGGQLQPNSTEWSLFHSILTMYCCLMFIYLMMSVLAKADTQSRKSPESTALVNEGGNNIGVGARSTSVDKELDRSSTQAKLAMPEKSAHVNANAVDPHRSAMPSRVALDVPD